MKALLFLLAGAVMLWGVACDDDASSEPITCDENYVLVGETCLADGDGDGVEDVRDNCPEVANGDQADADGDGVGDLCDEPDPDPDTDGDGILDAHDNCPEVANPAQTDHDGDGEGDACEAQEGTQPLPFIIPVEESGAWYTDSRDTSDSSSSLIDSYPPDTLDESGPEYYYTFTLPRSMKVSMWLDAEPDGVDIDLHLLSSLDPLTLVERANTRIDVNLPAGTYWLVLDTYEGASNAGPYGLNFSAEIYYPGTPDEPVLMGDATTVSSAVTLPVVFVDSRDTSESPSSLIDSYPPNTLDESGPEYYYAFTIDEPVYFAGELLLPEGDMVDIDIHLLSSLNPLTLIERDNHKIYAELEPGTYYVVLDSFGGDLSAGPYTLNITLRAQNLEPDTLFAPYMLQAVEYIDANWGRLGYDSAVLTHDFTYGDYGVIEASGGARTMCVAAVMEIILVAMELYAADTGDDTVWDYLPMRSYQYLGAYDIKAYLWVNYGDIDSGGSADALRHFGMGMNVPFERLVPGSVLNLNRTTGTGHAVVFLAYIDEVGNEYETWSEDIIGFKYYSSQGGYDVGSGGMDYRYAIFAEYGCPTMPYLRDCNISYDEVQYLLNCGVIYHPSQWRPAYYTQLARKKRGGTAPVSTFDAAYFNPRTTDDPR